jgi:hypothetical protein
MLKRKWFLYTAFLLGAPLINSHVASAMDNPQTTELDQEEDKSLAGVISQLANMKICDRPNDLLVHISNKMFPKQNSQTHFETIGIDKDLRDRIVKLLLMQLYRNEYDKPGFKQYSESELNKLKDNQIFEIVLESPEIKEKVQGCLNIIISIIRNENIITSSSSANSPKSITTKELEDLTPKELFKAFVKTQFYKTHTKAIHDTMISELCSLTQSGTLESISTNDLLTLFKDTRPVKLLALETEEIAYKKNLPLALRRNQSVQLFVYCFVFFCAYYFINNYAIDYNLQYETDKDRENAIWCSWLLWIFAGAFPSYWYMLSCEYINQKYY